MIARSLLLENRTGEARRLLLHVLGTHPPKNVRIGTLWGIGHSYLQENQLNKHQMRLLTWQEFQERILMWQNYMNRS